MSNFSGYYYHDLSGRNDSHFVVFTSHHDRGAEALYVRHQPRVRLVQFSSSGLIASIPQLSTLAHRLHLNHRCKLLATKSRSFPPPPPPPFPSPPLPLPPPSLFP